MEHPRNVTCITTLLTPLRSATSFIYVWILRDQGKCSVEMSKYVVTFHDRDFFTSRGKTFTEQKKKVSVLRVSCLKPIFKGLHLTAFLVGGRHKIGLKHGSSDCFWRYITLNPSFLRSRDSVVGIATGYGLDDKGVGIWVPVGSRIFSSPCRSTGSGVCQTSYPVGTGGSFPGGKAAGAWSWPLTSN
jgi:hypothetical protein